MKQNCLKQSILDKFKPSAILEYMMMVEKHNNKSFFESFENLEREREREREKSFDRSPLPPHTAPLRLTHILITNFFFSHFFFFLVLLYNHNNVFYCISLHLYMFLFLVGVLGWACCILFCLDFFKA